MKARNQASPQTDAPQRMQSPTRAASAPLPLTRLQRSAGNAATSLLIQRDQLTEEGRRAVDAATASPLTTLDELVALTERVEAAYPGGWKDTTTRLRKAYYDGDLWNSLIEDRKATAPVMTPPLSAGDFKALAQAKQHPEIVVPGGSVDIGHVLTGADSSNFPSVGTKFWMSGLDGPPAATWAGDVGSALAEWDMHTPTSWGRRDRSTRREYYDRFASIDDMLGDIDGIVLPKEPSPVENDSLSARIRDYYKPTGTSARRFKKFATASGFGVSGGRLDPTAVARIRSQVDNFGVAWLRKDRGALTGARGNWFYDEDIDFFVKQFTDWVETGIAREAAIP